MLFHKRMYILQVVENVNFSEESRIMHFLKVKIYNCCQRGEQCDVEHVNKINTNACEQQGRDLPSYMKGSENALLDF